MRRVLTVLTLLVLCSFTAAAVEPKKCVPVSPRDCTLVLTFDDGPRKEVLQGNDGLLNLLSRFDIKATFFVQGWQAKENPDLVKEMVRQRHLIANHTYGHASLSEIAKRIAKSNGATDTWRSLIPDARLAFITDAQRAGREIHQIIGYTPLFLRPPKWDIDQTLYCTLTERQWIVQTTEGNIHDSLCPHLESILSREKVLVPNEPREMFATRERELERTRRDVNTEDYAVYAWYLEKKDERFDEAVRKLSENARRTIARRESAGIRIHILTFHELSITVAALKMLIPEWKEQGYHFENLPWVYGVSEGWMPKVSEQPQPQKTKTK